MPSILNPNIDFSAGPGKRVADMLTREGMLKPGRAAVTDTDPDTGVETVVTPAQDPETPADALDRIFKDYLKRLVLRSERRAAEQSITELEL